MALIISVAELASIFKYAPGDTEEKPILSRRMKRRLKLSSVIILIFLLTVSILIGNYDRVISNILLLSTSSVTLLLSPAGYKLSKCSYGSLE
jgi:accessory gene regulator B